MPIRLLLLSCFSVLTLSAQPIPKEPPTPDRTFEGAAFTASFNGTRPMTYQWYKGTLAKRVAIPAPEGIQQTLQLKPTDPAGTYFVVVTNVAGSATSEMFRLSYTTSATAAKMQVVIKKP
jgi:hypothetical protein